MPRILVVDDEPKIVQLVRDYLEHGGFEVLSARDGREALMRARRERPDLVVLDLGLPEMDGLDVTRALRRETDVPLIMLTARDSETDKIVGLELGADDYLTKPFSPRELVARVRAVLRRHARDGMIRCGLPGRRPWWRCWSAIPPPMRSRSSRATGRWRCWCW